MYAVGAYADPADVKGKDDPAAALLDPAVPKSIRIVMNRGLSVDKYMAAIMEALEVRVPRGARCFVGQLAVEHT